MVGGDGDGGGDGGGDVRHGVTADSASGSSVRLPLLLLFFFQSFAMAAVLSAAWQ